MGKLGWLTSWGIALLTAGLGGCTGPANDANPMSNVRLSGTGASFVYPLMSKWTNEYQNATGVKINYQSTGSGAGIRQMTAQTVDFGCTDGPMNVEQLAKAAQVGGAVVHIPLVIGGVVPAYTLDQAKDPLKFSGPVLADIFLGNIKKWNHPALKKLNAHCDLPDQEIVVVRRSDGSGTTYLWADYLCKVSPEWKKKVGVGTFVNWPTGIGQKGNEGVAGMVKRTAGSIGFIELTFALQTKIQFGAVQNKDGAFVTASPESVAAAADNSLADIPDDLRYSITDASGKDSYPIAGISWAVCYTHNPGGQSKEVRDFLHWCAHDGQESCAPLHYARLPKALVERVEKRLELIK